ncbi:hypothetical protein BDV25DRAFT_30978 [Aspergillus avenaceus]|uniref:Uncharacterized protein n=1 Tax=Aspergillus avenaceus TaxID=36643 RepID=A0A5N6TN96_ASPAV|nr:hypothetical protein BDV25DRAFT_30978 [Aspergillus avenaceus]
MAQHADVEVHHGKKRPAERDPDGDQPLAKRLDRLRIDSVASDHASEKAKDSPDSSLQQVSSTATDMMMLDDTEHTVYIHDLEREIAESEFSSDSIKILPGVRGSLGSIPRFLVAETKPTCNTLVLYKEPISLTMPPEKDMVRKALIETRQRARIARAHQSGQHPNITDSGTIAGSVTSKGDRHLADVMDIDAGA